MRSDEFNHYSSRFTQSYAEQRIINELFYKMLKVNDEQEYFHQLTCLVAIGIDDLATYGIKNDDVIALIENISKISVKDKKAACFYPMCHKIGIYGEQIKVMLSEVVCDDIWSKFVVDGDNVYTRKEPLHELEGIK